MTKHPLFIHPSTPPKLIREFRKARYKYHVLAKARGINVKYVHEMIKYGKEPTNANIREKLFLPKKPRAERVKKPYIEPPEHIKWWRSLTKEYRNSFIQITYELEGEPNAKEIPDPSTQ